MGAFGISEMYLATSLIFIRICIIVNDCVFRKEEKSSISIYHTIKVPREETSLYEKGGSQKLKAKSQIQQLQVMN